MAWYSVVDIRANFNLSLASQLSDAQIVFALESAKDDFRDWLSAADFNLAEADNLTLVTDDAKSERIRRAHGYNTMYYLFLTVTQIRPTGVTVRERDENATTTNEYLSPAQLLALRAQYREKAESLIAPYRIAPPAAAQSSGSSLIAAGKWFLNDQCFD